MTVRNLLLDGSGDIAPLVNGNLQLASDLVAIEQAAACNLRTFLGEWFLDDPDNPKIGTPYFQKVLVKNPDPQQLRTVFRDAILAVHGVASVTLLDLRYTQGTRSLTVAWRGISDTGALISGQSSLPAP